ncbi:MAG: sigma-70 family RNA polymerase sigma factor [Candidatus Eisenbacteria bacterium]|nr:sigma-70 family RNA polymerase sigma factor [Candidatus Eisenbacteria bacterium]
MIRSRLFPLQDSCEADWDALYAEHLPQIYNFFRYRVGNPADAEDLTSETFERAWRARARYRRDLGAFGAWLFTIARNLAVDHYRGRRVMVSLEAAADIPGGATPEELSARRSDAERLTRLLERLPERERELIAWKFGAELTNREIARIVGLTQSNVGTILHRTILELRKGWSEEEKRDER